MEIYLDLGIQDQYRQMAEDIRTMRRRLTEIRATAASEDGLIRATVDGSGALVELRLDPRVHRFPAATLAGDITDIVASAGRDAQEQGLAIAAGHLSADAAPEKTNLRLDPALRELDRWTRAQARGSR